MINEFGTNQILDMDTFERGLFISAFATEALSSGASGCLYWGLHDIYFYEGTFPGDGLMNSGLWKFKDKNWSPRPMYYAYSLLTRYTESNSIVHKISNSIPGLAVAALTSPDEELTIIAVNSNYSEKIVPFSITGKSGIVLNKYIYSVNSLPTDEKLISTNSTIVIDDIGFTDTLPVQSMVVYTNFNPEKDNNMSPNEISILSGPHNGQVNSDYTFTATAYDVNGNQIRLIFDWGDGTASTSEFTGSGSQVSVNHSWRIAGSYKIAIKAIDEFSKLSKNSANHNIYINSKENSVNLLENASFEIYTATDGVADYWSIGKGGHDAILSLSDLAYEGSKSQRIDINSLASVGYIYMFQSQTIVDLKPNSKYTLSFYARGKGKISPHTVLNRYSYVRSGNIITLTDKWQKITSNLLTPDTVFCIDELIRFADSGNWNSGISSGDWVELDSISLTLNPINTNINDENEFNIEEFNLNQNYPNPFNSHTIIKYQLPHTDFIKIYIYNIFGQKVRKLISQNQQQGSHSIHWDGSNDEGLIVSSGLYFCKININNSVKIIKMLKIK